MASLNKVLLIGNLTRDPELRYIPSGTAVTTFTVASNRAYVNQAGEKKEEVCFIRIVVWSRRAEVCAEFLSKGSPVFVEGRLQSRTWEDQNGQKRSTIEVIANNVQFLGRGKSDTPPELQGQEHSAPNIEDENQAAAPDAAPTQDIKSPNEEVPF